VPWESIYSVGSRICISYDDYDTAIYFVAGSVGSGICVAFVISFFRIWSRLLLLASNQTLSFNCSNSDDKETCIYECLLLNDTKLNYKC
jgi:hypothetical protein